MTMKKEEMYEAMKNLLHDQIEIAKGHESQFGQGILYGLELIQNYIKFLEDNFGDER